MYPGELPITQKASETAIRILNRTHATRCLSVHKPLTHGHGALVLAPRKTTLLYSPFTMARDTPSPIPRGQSLLLHALVILSGVSALAYQILWMRQLGLLFGNTAHAAATTLTVFFLGLSAGSLYWGRRSQTNAPTLRTYALLETGIAVTALLVFATRPLFAWLLPAVYPAMESPAAAIAIKGSFALLMIFPPTFFMGGTIPVLGGVVIQQQTQFGNIAARLYGLNTIGAALGVLLSAFWLVPVLGFTLTCVLAIGLNLLIAVLAFKIDTGASQPLQAAARRSPESSEGTKPALLPEKVILGLCFLSGFAMLGLEVLWTRLLAQVHENSVYSFALVLIVVLVCLAVGALASSRLARTSLDPMHGLAGLLLLGGTAVTFFPNLMMAVSDDLQMMNAVGSFSEYVEQMLKTAFATIGPSCFLLGMVFPYLMKNQEARVELPARTIGTMSALNTIGGILGAIVCGFVLLQALGLWKGFQAIATLYLLAVLILPSGKSLFVTGCRVAAALILMVGWLGIYSSALPQTGRPDGQERNRLLESWQSSDCTVTVHENADGNRYISVNSHYNLGSTGARFTQNNQGRIPMFMHGNAKRIFFLGLGTGMSAGAVLDREQFPEVESVLACELVEEVVLAARKYMTDDGRGRDYTNGLFDDPRATIRVEDGRHRLMASPDTYDVINADLFLPYRNGAGSLYSRDHFDIVRQRLAPGGIFVQWLPMYQLTDHEFGVIARTMLESFDQVTLWWNNIIPGSESMALVGHVTPVSIPVENRDSLQTVTMPLPDGSTGDPFGLPVILDEPSLPFYYCANITALAEQFTDYPINTDDRPVIEYASPLNLSKGSYNNPTALVAFNLINLLAKLQDKHDTDPILQTIPEHRRTLPLAATALHEAFVYRRLGEEQKALTLWHKFANTYERFWQTESNQTAQSAPE